MPFFFVGLVVSLVTAKYALLLTNVLLLGVIIAVFQTDTHERFPLIDQLRFKFSPTMWIILILSIEFFLLTSLAMWFYPEPYDYLNLFFSDLGSDQAPNGENNHISQIIFGLALVLSGFVMLFYWFFMYKEHSSPLKSFSLAPFTGSFMGSLAATNLIVTSFFPLDSAHYLHLLFAGGGFWAIGVAVLVYSLLHLKKGYNSYFYGILGAPLGIAILLFVVGIFPDHSEPLIQKILVNSIWVWLIVTAFHSTKRKEKFSRLRQLLSKHKGQTQVGSEKYLTPIQAFLPQVRQGEKQLSYGGFIDELDGQTRL